MTKLNFSQAHKPQKKNQDEYFESTQANLLERKKNRSIWIKIIF